MSPRIPNSTFWDKQPGTGANPDPFAWGWGADSRLMLLLLPQWARSTVSRGLDRVNVNDGPDGKIKPR